MSVRVGVWGLDKFGVGWTGVNGLKNSVNF
jgi:hypothetical protein